VLNWGGKHFCYIFPLHNGLKHGMVYHHCCSVLQYAIRKVVPVGWEGLKLNGTQQPLVSADDTDLLAKNINTVRENTDFVVQ
jgi:hypothetical protein